MKNNFRPVSRILRNGFIFADNTKGKGKFCRVYEVGGGFVRNIMMTTEQVQLLPADEFNAMLKRYAII